jgi:hypothetical protein
MVLSLTIVQAGIKTWLNTQNFVWSQILFTICSAEPFLVTALPTVMAEVWLTLLNGFLNAEADINLASFEYS